MGKLHVARPTAVVFAMIDLRIHLYEAAKHKLTAPEAVPRQQRDDDHQPRLNLTIFITG
jgi:hypothetical protein